MLSAISPKMNHRKAVVFDLDDTLISEKLYMESGYRHIANVLSDRIDIDSRVIFTALCELSKISAQHVFDRLFNTFEIPYSKEMIMDLVEVYRNHIPDIQFYKDVLPCLRALRSKDILTGIISDGYMATQRNKLKAVHADNYFDYVIITEELGREYWKPHPRAFEIMRDKLNVRFEDMFYIGDNPKKDFFISSVYPIKTVRISRDGVYADEEYLDGVKETYTVDSLIDVPALLTDEGESDSG